MKKIPTLFERVFEDHKKVDIKSAVVSGMEPAVFWYLTLIADEMDGEV